MDSIRIRGNRPLAGKISIGGAKNAALPLMAASLLTDETLTLSNIEIGSGMYRNVLVYSSEITSRSLNPRQPDSMVLFGDAAAAAVVTRSAPGDASGRARGGSSRSPAASR